MNRNIQERRDRSPQPVRQPSPDIATANVIVSTRSPTTLQSSSSAKTPQRGNIPLLHELSELKRQNNQLRQALKSRPSLPSESTLQIKRLTQQLRIKQQQLQSLRSSGYRLSSSKKLNLTVNDSSQIKDLTDKILELREENRRLRDEIQFGGGEELRRLAKRVRELEEQNEDLKRRWAETAPGRRVKTMPDEDNSPGDNQVVRVEMERIRAEINGVFNREFQKLNRLVDQQDRRLTEVMSKQAAILSQHRKRIDNSANTKPHPQDSANTKPDNSILTPQRPTTTFFNTRMTTSQTIPSRIPQPSNPETRIVITRLQTQLSQARADHDRTIADNCRLQQQISYLSNEISRYQNRPTVPVVIPNVPVTSSTVSTIELTETVRRLERENEGLRSRVEGAAGRGEAVISQRELEQMKGQLGAMNTALDVKNREIEDLKNKIYKLDAILDAKNREIALLKNQLTIHSSNLDQKGRQSSLRDNQILALNDLIKDQATRLNTLQSQKNRQITLLQDQNKLLQQSLDSLKKSQTNLLFQLQNLSKTQNFGSRQQSDLRNDIQRLSNENTRLVNEIREIPQLRNEVKRLLEENAREKEKEGDLERQNAELRKINTELGVKLTAVYEEVRKDRDRYKQNDLEFDRLRSSHDKLVFQLAQIKGVVPEYEKNRLECERLQRVHDELIRTLEQLKGDNQYFGKKAEDQGKRVTQLVSQLKAKDEELLRVLDSKRSIAIEAYLRDLQQLRKQLQSLNLQPIQSQIHERNQRLKSLLSQKLSQVRLFNRQLQQTSQLTKQNTRLRKQALTAQSRFISQKQQTQKLRSWMQNQHREKQSLQREINELKNIINEYINKQVVFDISENSQIQTEIKVLEEEYRITTTQQQATLTDVTKLKFNFQQAIMKLDSISNKIRKQLAEGMPS